MHDGVTETVSFSDGAGVLVVFEELTGDTPEVHRGEEWYNSGYMTYDGQR